MPPMFSWTDLPSELLDLIAKHLISPTDIQHFRAVCQSWRLSVSPIPHLLSLVLPYKLKYPEQCPFGNPIFQPLTITAAYTYILEPLYSNDGRLWVIRVEEIEPGKLSGRKVLTQNHPTNVIESAPKNLNLSNVKVVQVATGYNFFISKKVTLPYAKLLLYPSPHTTRKSSSSSTNTLYIHNWEALVLNWGKLFMVHLQDEKWNIVKAGRVSRFDDIILFRGKNYTLDRKGRLYSFTFWKALTCIIRDPILPSNNQARKRLVEWRENLYLIQRDKHVIRVHKLNQHDSKWEEVHDLGGKLLFVGFDSCFFVDIQNFPRLLGLGNTVIFNTKSFSTYGGGCALTTSFYSLGAAKFESVPHWSRMEKLFTRPPDLEECQCCGETIMNCLLLGFKLIEDLEEKRRLCLEENRQTTIY